MNDMNEATDEKKWQYTGKFGLTFVRTMKTPESLYGPASLRQW